MRVGTLHVRRRTYASQEHLLRRHLRLQQRHPAADVHSLLPIKRVACQLLCATAAAQPAAPLPSDLLLAAAARVLLRQDPGDGWQFCAAGLV